MTKTNVKIITFALSVIGTLATVVSCVIAYVMLRDSQTAQNNINTSTSEQTTTPEYTLIPSSPTSIPSYTPTVTLLTNTPVPTPTSSITSNDSILEVGEWWKSENAWLRLREVKYSELWVALYFYMEYWNKSGNTLAFKWSTNGNFTLTDNTGFFYPFDIDYTDVGDNEIIGNGEIVTLIPPFRSLTVAYEVSHYFDSSVTDLYLIVTELSEIQFAKWRVEISP